MSSNRLVKNNHELVKQFEKALVEEDILQIKSLLTEKLLNEPLNELAPSKSRALDIVLNAQKTAAAKFLIQCGAKTKDFPALGNHKQLKNLIATRDELYTTINEALSALKEKCATLLSSYQQPELIARILRIINTKLNDYAPDTESNLEEKLDLYCIVNMLLKSLELFKKEQDIFNEIKKIFAKREDSILNTSLDYCYAINSIANKICYDIASLITDKNQSPYNILLKKACTENRKNPWFDPGYGIEATDLPESKEFFRLSGNEIHLYEHVVNQAIARLKDGKTRLAHIWFGSDSKNITPVPPLDMNTLNLLKQRSPAFRALIDYTEKIDQESSKSNSIIEKLKNLKNGLHAGDYRSTNSHLYAGGAAYAAIAEFSEWWNSLSTDQRNKINNVKCSQGSGENLGSAIHAMLGQDDLYNTKRRDCAYYCVSLRGDIIERFIENEYDTLKSLEIAFGQEIATKLVSHQELDMLHKAILQELQYPQTILLPATSPFPNVDQYGAFNNLLLQQGFIQDYDDFIGGNKAKDTHLIIKFILSQSDNSMLEHIRKILNLGDFDYLRKCTGRTQYYAIIYGERTKSSEEYARIEKALSLQMVKNTIANKTTPQDAYQAVHTLCEDYKFIKNNRKGFFHFFNSNTSTIFNGKRQLETSHKMMDKEIENMSRKRM